MEDAPLRIRALHMATGRCASVGDNKNTVQRVFQSMGWRLPRSGKACTAGSALEHEAFMTAA